MDTLGIASNLLAIAAIIMQMVRIHRLKEKLKVALILGASVRQYHEVTYGNKTPDLEQLSPFINQAEFGYEMAKKQKKVTL